MRQLEDEKVSWLATQESTKLPIEEKQNNIDELRRLHQQVQSNLEHYREAAREQRMVDEQRYMQTQIQLEQMLQQLRTELDIVKQDKFNLQSEYQELRYSYENFEKQFIEKNSLYESIKAEFANTQKAMIKFEEAKNHWQSQYTETLKKLEEKSALSVDLKAKLAVLTQEKKFL